MDEDPDAGQFYDDFAERVLLEDFCHLNLRQEAIKELCDRFIPRSSRILEVGCGVGVISKHLGKRASRLLSIDISAVNLRIAEMYVDSPSSKFRVLDITRDFHRIDGLEFDVILLADVIEHIPREKYTALFWNLERLLAPGGLMLLTFPSFEYQEYIKRCSPDILQVVDESVRLSDMLAVTSLTPIYFSYRDVWGKNQYVHLVLQSEVAYSADSSARCLPHRLARKVKEALWILRHRSFLKRVEVALGEDEKLET